MLLVHLELCYRAGFSIAWQKTEKTAYLTALSQEIDRPGHGILDKYLLQFKEPQLIRGAWGNALLSMQGLDGLDDGTEIDGDLNDPTVADNYKKFEEKRGYTYAGLQSLSEHRRPS